MFSLLLDASAKDVDQQKVKVAYKSESQQISVIKFQMDFLLFIFIHCKAVAVWSVNLFRLLRI